jgi:hypothetical protein
MKTAYVMVILYEFMVSMGYRGYTNITPESSNFSRKLYETREECEAAKRPLEERAYLDSEIMSATKIKYICVPIGFENE